MIEMEAPVLSVYDEQGNKIPVPAIQGESAYEVAKNNGFEGTESEWLDSLKGEPDKSLGILGAKVGDTIKVKAVDSQGVPTEWEPVDMAGGGGSDISFTEKTVLAAGVIKGGTAGETKILTGVSYNEMKKWKSIAVNLSSTKGFFVRCQASITNFGPYWVSIPDDGQRYASILVEWADTLKTVCSMSVAQSHSRNALISADFGISDPTEPMVFFNKSSNFVKMPQDEEFEFSFQVINVPADLTWEIWGFLK